MTPTITERGWPGHFILGHRCTFRRNTLIECGEKRVVVSTVGNMLTRDERERATVGLDRHYETMAFEAVWNEPYWEADTGRQIDFDSEWAVSDLERGSDQKANEMHEAVIREIAATLEADQ